MGELGKRIATGIPLVATAVAALWAGGIAFAALAAVAVLLMWAEWAGMHRLPLIVRRIGLAVLALMLWITAVLQTPDEGLMLLGGAAGMMMILAGKLARGAGRPAAIGLLYCGLPGIALIWLRGQGWGIWATLLLMLVVWGADIAAYFTGRAIGGPKLAPAISPNKTWSGAMGGLLGAVAASLLLMLWWPGYAGLAGALRLAMLAVPLAVLSILGDLYESWLKRRCGVKDSGTILPGHGGVMDRLDGLVPVAVAGAGIFAVTGWAG
jgi:phosphatidate cytidylyltransferase